MCIQINVHPLLRYISLKNIISHLNQEDDKIIILFLNKNNLALAVEDVRLLLI